MFKTHKGLPPNFKGLGWSSALKELNMTLQQIYNPLTKEFGLNYKNKTTGKNMSITFADEDGQEYNSEDTLKKIRQFEIEEFDIPDRLSPYK